MHTPTCEEVLFAGSALFTILAVNKGVVVTSTTLSSLFETTLRTGIAPCGYVHSAILTLPFGDTFLHYFFLREYFLLHDINHGKRSSDANAH
jgi:hypothetical protein